MHGDVRQIMMTVPKTEIAIAMNECVINAFLSMYQR